jgi:predicted HicB family RNase H-like nuclease
MMDQLQGATLEERRLEAYRVASALYRQDPDWVTFFREILGIGGAVRRLFPEREWMGEFEKTTECSEIQLMLARLRQRSSTRGDGQEPIRVITVRLPRSLHETLQAEACTHQMSMNKLCITKLLQIVDGELTEIQFNAPGDADEQTNP